jgi:hypothetical protein
MDQTRDNFKAAKCDKPTTVIPPQTRPIPTRILYRFRSAVNLLKYFSKLEELGEEIKVLIRQIKSPNIFYDDIEKSIGMGIIQ